MKRSCPNISCKSEHIVKDGFYHRPSDGRDVQRLQCKKCGKKFSFATGTDTYFQKKRRVNYLIYELLCGGVSQNRIALQLHINRKTVARKLIFLGNKYRLKSLAELSKMIDSVDSVQFDELISIEHTKCKPLTVALGVEKCTRRILGLEVSKIPASGLLAKIAFKKYGYRPNHRERGLHRLFTKISPYIKDTALWESDQYPTYQSVLHTVLKNKAIDKGEFDSKSFEENPPYRYMQYKGEKATISGQGELKKKVFDPLFSINHTFAMHRYNINRLVRRTWNTTKKISALENHLYLYMHYHNSKLISK